MANDSSSASMESRPNPSPNSAASGWMVVGSALSLSVCTISVATSCSRARKDIVSYVAQSVNPLAAKIPLSTHGAVVSQEAVEPFLLPAIRKPGVTQRSHNRFGLDAGLGRIPPILHQRLHVTVSRRRRKGDAQHGLDVKP